MEEFNSADILEKQNRKKRLATLEVGLFEISFVLIIIIVLFGLLNYFNILSLSTLYPNQLAFLPHQKFVQPKPLNTPTPYPPNNPAIPPKLAHQASDSQITSYKVSLEGGKVQLSNPKENQFNGIFAGFDNDKLVVIDKNGLKYFYLTNSTVFGKFTLLNSLKPNSSSSTAGFPNVKKEDFLSDSNFGTIIQIIYDSSSSAGLTAKEIYIFNKI